MDKKHYRKQMSTDKKHYRKPMTTTTRQRGKDGEQNKSRKVFYYENNKEKPILAAGILFVKEIGGKAGTAQSGRGAQRIRQGGVAWQRCLRPTGKASGISRRARRGEIPP